jgi:hypothetical protein
VGQKRSVKLQSLGKSSLLHYESLSDALPCSIDLNLQFTHSGYFMFLAKEMQTAS